MLSNKSINLAGLLLLFFLASCGTTRVYVNYPDATIYANKKMIGTGTGKLTRTGFPHGTLFTAKAGNQEIGRLKSGRGFTFLTLVTGLLTDGIAVPFTFQYPKKINIPLNPGIDRFNGVKSPWDAPPKDKW